MFAGQEFPDGAGVPARQAAELLLVEAPAELIPAPSLVGEQSEPLPDEGGLVRVDLLAALKLARTFGEPPASGLLKGELGYGIIYIWRL